MNDLSPAASQSHLAVSARVIRELNHIELEDGLCVFRLKHEVTFDEPVPDNLKAVYGARTQEGFATPQAIADFLQGNAPQLSTLKDLVLVPEGFLAHAQTQGYSSACEKYEAGWSHRNVYELFQLGMASLDRVITLETSSHLLFDRRGSILPTALPFDYMNGHIRDGSYRLDKVIEILKEDPRITPVEAERNYGKREPLTQKNWKPVAVPYYNASKGCSQHVAFRFAPTQEDMQRMWEKMRSYGTQYPSTENYRAIFDLDVLGLRAGGAAKYDAFYGEDASSDDEDD